MKTLTKSKPTHGDLRIWWIPQIPGKPFNVPVDDIVEAALLINTLASYDEFQLENNIKPDYSNAGGLSVFDANDDHDGPNGSWCDWYNEDGEDLDELVVRYGINGLRQLREHDELPKWEGQ